MSAQPNNLRQVGRGQSKGRGRCLAANESPRKLEDAVYAAERAMRQAEQNLAKLTKRATSAGVFVKVGRTSASPLVIDGEIAANPDFKLRRRHLHVYPKGLDDPGHGHLVIELSDELSPECVAELSQKVTNGKVTYDRDVHDGYRWRVVHHMDDNMSYMAAD